MNHDEILITLASLIHKVEETLNKFNVGSSQHSLQVNRLHALKVAETLVRQSAGLQPIPSEFDLASLNVALAPLESLISKSTKAQAKLVPGSWQHSMLEKNLEALHPALVLLKKALESKP